MTGGRGERDGARPPLQTRVEAAMGTVFSVTTRYGDLPEADLGPLLGVAFATLHRAEEVFSTWDERSPVSRLRRGEASLSEMPGEVVEVLALCREAKRASGGWFDPWAMPGGVDPTGLVKGWAVDRALAVLRDGGVAGAMVNGGGDLAVFGAPEVGQRWRVGLRHPWRGDALAGIIEAGAAVATSGGYERGAHLIDPATGLASCAAASATVTGPALALADALATALAVGGDEVLGMIASLDGYEGYLIRPDGSEATTDGIAFVS